MKTPELKERLMPLIDGLTEDQLKILLTYLEGLKAGYRMHPRTDCHIPADYTVHEKTFQDFIHNISAGGVYITSGNTHLIGREISMDFKLTGYPKSIRIFGKIVRSDAKGFAVKFYEEMKESLNGVRS